MADRTDFFNFSNAANHTLVNTQLLANKLKLAQPVTAGLLFAQDFASGVGFTLDAAKAEFVAGLVRQIDLRPLNASFYASFNSGKDGNWGDGSLTGTLVNGATVSGGRLDLTGDTAAKHAAYTAVSNADHVSKIAIRFDFIPNYTGSPSSSTQTAFIIRKDDLGGNENLLAFNHIVSTGQLRLNIFSNTGAVNNIDFGVFSATSGVKVEIEINIDITPSSEAIRLFVDGVQFGSTSALAVTRDSSINIFKIGGTSNTDFKIDNFIVFSEVQHTTNYTPGAVISEVAFAETKVDLPDFSHLGPGTMSLLTNFTTTEVGAPRYIFEGKFWNGSAWVTSDNSYAQASSKADALANLAVLDVSIETVFSVSIVFPDSISQSSVDQLDITYSGNRFSANGTSQVALIACASANELKTFTRTGEVIPANTSLKYGVGVDGVLMFFDTGGSVWANSDGSLGQLNTATEINDNALALLGGTNSTLCIHIRLETTDNTITPELDTFTLTYEFGGVATFPPTCLVFGYVRDIAGVGEPGATVRFLLHRENNPDQYKEASSNIISSEKSTLTDTVDDPGLFQQDLIRSSAYEGVALQLYRVEVTLANGTILIKRDATGAPLLFEVPDALQKDITDQIAVA